MIGATSAILKMHHSGKCPSVMQRTIRLTLTRLSLRQDAKVFIGDSRQCNPEWLKSPKLYLEYKRKD